MRLVLFFATLIVVALAAYLSVAGFFLARTVATVLTVTPPTALERATEAPTDPLALGFRGNPMVALSLPFEVVAIETQLGPAEAWFVPANGAESGRAIYVHGIGGAREDGYRHLSLLHKAGWSVLLVSYRNDDDAPQASEGTYGMGLLEWPDLEAAVEWSSRGPDGPGLLIVADSMGAAILGQFMAQSPLADRVSAVALDSPALSFRAVIGHLATQSGQPLPYAIAPIAALLVPRTTGLPLTEAEVAPVFAAFAGPLFLAHGAGDQLVPIGPSLDLAQTRSGKTVVHWTEAAHLGSFTDDPAAYEAAFTAFLSSVEG